MVHRQTCIPALLPGTRWVTTLDDKALNYPVKLHAILETLTSQKNKVVYGNGSILREELQLNIPEVGLDGDYVLSALVDSHWWWAGLLKAGLLFGGQVNAAGATGPETGSRVEQGDEGCVMVLRLEYFYLCQFGQLWSGLNLSQNKRSTVT
jgi:hypothetical protein